MPRAWNGIGRHEKKALTIICVGVRTSYGHQSYEDSNLEGQDRMTRRLWARCKCSRRNDVITFLDHLPPIRIDFWSAAVRVYLPYITKVGNGGWINIDHKLEDKVSVQLGDDTNSTIYTSDSTKTSDYIRVYDVVYPIQCLGLTNHWRLLRSHHGPHPCFLGLVNDHVRDDVFYVHHHFFCTNGLCDKLVFDQCILQML